MTVHTGPRPTGTPTWADLMVPDLEAATTFYGAVLGWTFPPAEAGAMAGGFTYLSAMRDGQVVAGIGAFDAPQEGQAPAWATYLATDDIEATTAAAVAAGASVLVPPDSVGPTSSPTQSLTSSSRRSERSSGSPEPSRSSPLMR